MPRTLRVSTRNAAYQRLDALKRNRTKRHQERAFFVEGVRAIDAALARGWEIESFVFTDGARLSAWAHGIVRASRAATHLAVSAELMAALSDKEETSELVAIARIPPDDLGRIEVREDLLVAVVDRPASPGNLGTIIRTCDALGAHGVVITGHGADLYDPATVRATVGSLFAIPCVRAGSADDVASWVAAARSSGVHVRVVGSSAHAEVRAADADLTGPVVVVLGNETRGMASAYREMCDLVVTIPMRGSASSLNVAGAAAILLYEVSRQRV